MTNKEKAMMTYNAIKYRKRKKDQEATSFSIEHLDRILKRNYKGKKRIGC
ncbi:hypothetical protein [uncultured Clostridium sp.]|nr:hypothetical protein [uncultured Clostridium sp.]MDU1348299.1 hypothetical protein [Clostridium argentinense]